MPRKRCECNYTELALGLALKFSGICSKQDIVREAGNVICKNAAEYIRDMNSRSDAEVQKYLKIANLNNRWLGQVKEVYVCGKSTKSMPKICELNKNVERKQAKADVFVELTNGTYIGFSVKMNPKCTLTNYSIEKLLPSGKELKDMKKKFLSENGFETFQKSERPKHNELFYCDNVYWENLHKNIITHKSEVLSKIKSCIFPSNLPYMLYEFDGSCMKDLRTFDTETIEIERVYPTKKNGNGKNAAKMFHKLKIGDFQFASEIRWKGNVFHSPQIMITCTS